MSRRKMISLGMATGAVAICPQLLSRTAFGESEVRSTTLSVDDLLVAVPTSASSSAGTLDRFFPGLSADAEFRQLSPLSFLVSNLSNWDVRAFSSKWTIATSGDAREMALLHYFHPRAGRARRKN